MDLDPQQDDPASISSTLQLAWALVLAAYTDCQDIVFGIIVQEPTDPVASVRLVRINIQPDLAVDKALAPLDKGRPNALAIHHGPMNEGFSDIHPLLVTGEVLLDRGRT